MRAPTPDTPPPETMPDWLPIAVRSHLLIIEKLKLAVLPDAIAMQHRLATDSRMHYVWRELERQGASDKALVEFFECAFNHLPRIVTTPKDRAAFAASWSKAAELCRWTKQHDFAARMNPDLAAALDRVARHFDEVARKEGRLDSPLVVKHHSKNDQVRAYVRLLGNTTKRLFGSTLFRTVATTASVALDQGISWQQVRDWAKS